MPSPLAMIGIAIASGGLLIEAIAILAMGRPSLRQKTRFSPFSMLPLGFACFVVGLLIYAAG